jgi:hypothetical protein
VTRNDTLAKVTLQLARDGEALLPIIISAKAAESTKAVAADMAEYLSRISGATFKVEVGDGNSGIVLGSMADFPTPALAKALEIHNGFDGKEAYAIRTRDKKVLLLGATDLGASHAAYRFLETLGCRWFFPHKAWEVVPSTPDLQWNRDITDRPQMLARSIWFEGGSGKDYADWKRRNAQAQSMQISIAGGGMMLPKEIMDAHPEYWAARKQPDGTLKRDPSSLQLELGNPEVRKLLVEAYINYFKQNPNAEMANMEPSDTTAHSQIPESLALGSVSDQVFGMANEIARALQKAFPGQNKTVGLLSYNAYYDPPSFNMEPNVHIQLSPIGHIPKFPEKERYETWGKRSQNLGVYEYYSVFAWTNDKLPGSYTNNVRASQKHIRDELVGRGVISISAESTESWGPNGRGFYVANKLLWNPNLDLDALLQDFYTKAFGPAARDMQKYYDRLDPGNNQLMSASLLGQIFRDLDNATKAAANRPDVLARIDQIKLYLRYVDLMWYRESGGQVEDAQIMSNLYRTRSYGLTSWTMISQSWGGGRDSDAPYTREEIEKNFQEGYARYKGKIRDDLIPRQTFSTDLVSIKWPNANASTNDVKTTQTYQGTMKYALISLKGEPLEFTTEAGDAWGYKTEYSVKDSQGRVLDSGKPESKKLLTHKIPVPAPGIYYLTYYDPGAYWTFTAQPSLPYTIVALPEVATAWSPAVLPQMYFYVPKGTQKIEYFATAAHKVYGPDGSEQKLLQTGNDWVTIPVPLGMDGKPWIMRDLGFGKYYFSNIPSYFSPTIEGLLVPREVAQKDGLEIR